MEFTFFRQVIGELTAAMLAGSALHRGMATMVSWRHVGRELSHVVSAFLIGFMVIQR
jgi:hypothetical protein